MAFGDLVPLLQFIFSLHWHRAISFILILVTIVEILALRQSRLGTADYALLIVAKATTAL
jgi:hypothetical protein